MSGNEKKEETMQEKGERGKRKFKFLRVPGVIICVLCEGKKSLLEGTWGIWFLRPL
jgi:hypothetical protein